MAGNREPVEVEFLSKMSTADNCICNACFTEARVIKLSLPSTYFTGGRKLTSYDNYWLCRECRDKLVRALEWIPEWGAENAEDHDTLPRKCVCGSLPAGEVLYGQSHCSGAHGRRGNNCLE